MQFELVMQCADVRYKATYYTTYDNAYYKFSFIVRVIWRIIAQNLRTVKPWIPAWLALHMHGQSCLEL